jgi:signal transduction histidine kinase
VSGVLPLVGGSVAAGALTAAALARQRWLSYGKAMARACHELRGPLTAARLGLEPGLMVGQLPTGRLHAIDFELERATLALEDLSELWQRRGLRRRGRSRASVRGEPVDVAELLADSVEAWRGAAVARGVGLGLVSGGAAVVAGERLRLAQAVDNLIVNAIEHGGGTVEVSFRTDATSVRIEVVDDGPGLAAPVAELERRRPRPRGWRCPVPARGHGLAIAGAIARAHGGRLAGAPSERGARLVLDLPLQARGEPDAVGEVSDHARGVERLARLLEPDHAED